MMTKLNDHASDLWLPIVIGMTIAYMQNSEKRRTVRVAIAGLSGGIGSVVSPEIDIKWIGPNAEAIIVTAFAFFLIDLAFGILRDRKLIVGVVRALTGVRGGNDERD
jgi:uncharacterized membrane protein